MNRVFLFILAFMLFANIAISQKSYLADANKAYLAGNYLSALQLFKKQAKTNRNDPKGWQRNLLSRTDEQEQRYSNPDNDPRGAWSSGDLTSNKTSDERPNLYFGVLNPNTNQEVFPSKRRVWGYEKKLFETLLEEKRIWWGENGNNFPRLKKFISEVAEGIVASTWWPREIVGDNQEARRELRNLFTDDVADNITPKPTKLIEMIFTISGNANALSLDFFAGSGTTAHAVMNLNREDGGRRKYILVEMGEHFNTVILPRIKKVAFSDQWKDGKAQKGKGVSHFVKYFELEQYEDTLKRAHYEDAPLLAGMQDLFSGYAFLRDLKMLDAVKVDTQKNTVEVHLEKLYGGLDLAETLSCLTGKWIKRITPDRVEFQDGTSANLSNPDWNDVKSLIWW